MVNPPRSEVYIPRPRNPLDSFPFVISAELFGRSRKGQAKRISECKQSPMPVRVHKMFPCLTHSGREHFTINSSTPTELSSKRCYAQRCDANESPDHGAAGKTGEVLSLSTRSRFQGKAKGEIKILPVSRAIYRIEAGECFVIWRARLIALIRCCDSLGKAKPFINL